MRRIRLALPIALLLLAGCGGEMAEAPPPDLGPPPPKEAAAAPVPRGHLARTDVDRVLTEVGPAWVFRRVLHREVLQKGKFVGWQLTGLPEEWRDIDLQPGDVVTRVNDLALETPDHAWEVWKSVAKLKAIKVHLIRAGQARILTIPIDGEPDAKVAQRLEQGAPRAPAQRGVVQIGGHEEEVY